MLLYIQKGLAGLAYMLWYRLFVYISTCKKLMWTCVLVL